MGGRTFKTKMMDYFFNTPPDFNSDETNEPFKVCLICSEDLLHSGVPYSIEKAKKVLETGDEVTLYEMAICMPCAEQMNKRVSDHSRKVMEEFFEEIGLMELRQNLPKSDNPGAWKERCMLSGKPKADIKEYNIVAQMVNGRMMFGMPPMLIDLSVMEPLQEKLSPETKEEFDNFRDEFLAPSDPELRALLAETNFVFF